MNNGSILTVPFRFVGAYRDFTGWLGEKPNQYAVENGRTTLVGSAQNIAGAARQLALFYQAFPEGSPELAAKELEVYGPPKGGEGEGDGSSDPQAGGTVSDGPADVPGADRQDGGQPSQEGAAVGSDTGNPEAGEAERGADGNGPQDLVNDPKPAAPDERLLRALAKLNPDIDAHWTKDGLPALAAVESFYGSAGVKRADVTAAAPGLRRNTAPKLG